MKNDEPATEANCPFCGAHNELASGGCKHYAGYLNVADCEWEFDGPLTELGAALTDEYDIIEHCSEVFADIVCDGRERYITEKLKSLAPNAKYEEDAESVQCSPTYSDSSTLVFINDTDAKEILKVADEVKDRLTKLNSILSSIGVIR